MHACLSLPKDILQEDTVFEGIKLTKTKGEHGRGELVELAGKVCDISYCKTIDNLPKGVYCGICKRITMRFIFLNDYIPYGVNFNNK